MTSSTPFTDDTFLTRSKFDDDDDDVDGDDGGGRLRHNRKAIDEIVSDNTTEADAENVNNRKTRVEFEPPVQWSGENGTDNRNRPSQTTTCKLCSGCGGGGNDDSMEMTSLPDRISATSVTIELKERETNELRTANRRLTNEV